MANRCQCCDDVIWLKPAVQCLISCVTVSISGRGRFNRGTGEAGGKRGGDRVVHARKGDVENGKAGVDMQDAIWIPDKKVQKSVWRQRS